MNADGEADRPRLACLVNVASSCRICSWAIWFEKEGSKVDTRLGRESSTPRLESTGLRDMRTFSLVWAGQAVSLLGSSMSGFALGVWVFLKTGSAVSFALTLLLNMLPKAVLAPAAGLWADRRDRRWILIVTDLVAGLATASAAMLFLAGQLAVWHVYALTAWNAAASALQGPAFGAAITQLVPKERYGQANGMVQIGEAAAQIGAPVLAGAMLGSLGLVSVLLTDLGTLLFAVAVLAACRFPPLRASEGSRAVGRAHWPSQLGEAFGYVRSRPGLLGLIEAFALVNLFVGVAEALLTPMVLSFAAPETLGLIMTVGGLGMLIGSLLFTATGGGRRRIYAVFGGYAVLSIGVVLAGLRPSAPLIGAAVFLAFLALPTVMGASQTILQAKVAPTIQGRVFGLRMALNTLAFAIAYTLSGLLADRVFEPFMASHTQLAILFGSVIGFGSGRGKGLLFIVTGILAIGTALSAFASPRIRRVELELPDAALNEDGRSIMEDGRGGAAG
jgi:DHA3 family macrolide efflux protein-like MFS transporter